MLYVKWKKLHKNDYTCILSWKVKAGSYTLDYCIIPHEDVDKYSDFKVSTVSDLINDMNNCHSEFASASKPDHSVLSWKVKTGSYTHHNDNGNNMKTTFTVFEKTIPDNLLEDRISEIETFVNQFKEKVCDQNNMDITYSEFSDIVNREMTEKLNPKEVIAKNGQDNKRRKMRKQWWSNDLSEIWNTLCKKGGGNMITCKTNQKRQLRGAFNSYRKYFSKEVQKGKRQFWKRKRTEIESLENNNPKMFWKEIGKLGIGKDRRQFIPMEVVLPNGEISTNEEEVLREWKNGFNSLLNPVANGRSNDKCTNSDSPCDTTGCFDEQITIKISECLKEQ